MDIAVACRGHQGRHALRIGEIGQGAILEQQLHHGTSPALAARSNGVVPHTIIGSR